MIKLKQLILEQQIQLFDTKEIFLIVKQYQLKVSYELQQFFKFLLNRNIIRHYKIRPDNPEYLKNLKKDFGYTYKFNINYLYDFESYNSDIIDNVFKILDKNCSF